MRQSLTIFGLAWIFSLMVGLATTRAASSPATPAPTLQDLIQQKSTELQKIQEQRDALQKQLDAVNSSSRSLSKEIRYIDSTIGELNLSIKANTLTIEKLELEIGELSGTIEGLSGEIERKQLTIGKLFVELQQRDHENLLTVLLRNRSLSDSVLEIQTTVTLNRNLMSKVQDLRQLQSDLTNKLVEADEKKEDREAQQKNLASRQQIVAEQRQDKQRLLTSTKNQERTYQQLITELERQQDEISAEVEKIEAVLRQSIDPNLLPVPRPRVFLWPVPGGLKTQDYGGTKFALRNYRGKHHNGLDIGGVPIGTEVLAAERGVVINVGNQDKFCPKGAYGRFVVIKHENGLTTLYGHLSRYTASVGTRVDRGDVIGYIGRSGWATGPHLHFTVFATQTLTPARPGFPEGAQASRLCGPMPVGGDLDPSLYL